MFVAMNRFHVALGREEAFEAIWKSRNGSLAEMPGFCSFQLLRGETATDEGYTLFASHTLWASRQDFVNWTASENFRRSHRNTGADTGLYVGHPKFEGFSVVEGA